MKKIYTDTSVIGGCFDVEFRDYSLALMDEFKNGEKVMICSDLVVLELEPARPEIRDKLSEIPTDHVVRITRSEEVEHLARTYIELGALTNKSHNDALHIAYATLSDADTLASWNFKHIVNFDKIKMFNAINSQLGYKTIEIMTPRLILRSIYEKEKTI
jgi:hypothetical protein